MNVEIYGYFLAILNHCAYYFRLKILYLCEQIYILVSRIIVMLLL